MKGDTHGWNHRRVLVLGLGASGRAAAKLLRRCGAEVVAVDESESGPLRRTAEALEGLGIPCDLGVRSLPAIPFDFGVVSPGVNQGSPVFDALVHHQVPVVGELELGFQACGCPVIAVTGTNGKTTTTEMIVSMLRHCGRAATAAGNIGLPISAVWEATQRLDFLVVEVSSFQLERIQSFRPRVAVLLNLANDHLDRYRDRRQYWTAKARIFANQRSGDWAVVQREALEALAGLEIVAPKNRLTLSRRDPLADLRLTAGRIVGRRDGLRGELLELGECAIGGGHNGENMMAALLVGHILGLPISEMRISLRSFKAAAHRCEEVARIGRVRFINDSKATNPAATAEALESIAPSPGRARNIWLIAGGRDKNLEFASLGERIQRRVQGVALIGETRQRLYRLWRPFAPCFSCDSLIKAVSVSLDRALPRDVVLFSPACASFDMFKDYRHRGEVFRTAVFQLKSEKERRDRHRPGRFRKGDQRDRGAPRRVPRAARFGKEFA